MLKKMSFATAVIGMALFTLAPLAASAAPAPPVTRRLGTMTASGTGVAAVNGAAYFQATSAGGVLLVLEQGRSVTVKTDGKQSSVKWFGFSVYSGVHSASVIGQSVAVILVGGRMDLHVTGRGLAHFHGIGRYNSSTGIGGWSSAGSTVRLGSAGS